MAYLGGYDYGYGGYGEPAYEYAPQPYYPCEPMMEYPPEVYCEPVYQDYYYPVDYYDAQGAGCYGPWPADYYSNPRPCQQCESDSDSDDECCHSHKCRPRCNRKSDVGDLLNRFERDLDTKFGGKSRRREPGLVGQWQRILDKFPDKKARIVEVCDSDDEDCKDLRLRQLKKRAAEKKRDRLLEAIHFNGDAPVPGKSNTIPSQQVVHIDFGGGKPGGPHGGPRPMQPPNVARAFSHPTVDCHPYTQPQVLYYD